MGMCFAPGCKHYNDRDKCRFFKFPTNPKLLSEWAKSVRRKDKEPTPKNIICQCHFKDGLKENGPTIFAHNKDKVFLFESPEKHTKKRKITPECNPSSHETPVSHPSTSQSLVKDIEIDSLKNEILLLKKENAKLKKQRFGFFSIEENEDLISYYTGLPSKEIFLTILDICSRHLVSYYEDWKVEILDQKDQLLLTLMKLRRNLGHVDLGVRFAVSQGTVTNVYLTWLHCLHEALYIPLMSTVPSQTKNELCLPSCFVSFRNCRMIVDCTEFYVVRPKRMDHQRLFFSSYKHSHTMKGLIGVAPNGVITYVSDLFPGSTSDKEVFKRSGVLNVFEPGDLVVADKGFLITDIVPDGVSVNIPPFLSTPQFTPSQVTDTTRIARARIHVERAIGRIKVFKITDNMPKSMFPYASKIIQVCVMLTNFRPPLLKEVEHLY